MFDGLPILSLITVIPLIGALIIMLASYFSKSEEAKAQIALNSTWVALIVSGVVFILSVLLTLSFDRTSADFQFFEEAAWLGGGIQYRMGVDGISILFILLTAFLTPLCILASKSSVKNRVLEYMVAFLILESVVIGVFCAMDLVLFYLFFEAVLIPMYIIIGVWGGKNRVYASYKFFLYTLLGSVLMLAAIFWIYNFSGQVLNAPTTDMRVLMNDIDIPGGVQTCLLYTSPSPRD